jgi:hypothetical protein
MANREATSNAHKTMHKLMMVYTRKARCTTAADDETGVVRPMM